MSIFRAERSWHARNDALIAVQCKSQASQELWRMYIGDAQLSNGMKYSRRYSEGIGGNRGLSNKPFTSICTSAFSPDELHQTHRIRASVENC